MGENSIEVSCYSGHTYAQEPRSFRWQGVTYQVDEVEKVWRGPGERHFQVRGGGNKTFRLCYNEVMGRWSAVEVG